MARRDKEFVFKDKRGRKMCSRDIFSIDDDNAIVRVFSRAQGKNGELGTYTKKDFIEKFW